MGLNAMEKLECCGQKMRLVWNIPPKNVVYGMRYRTKSLYQCAKCKRIEVR